MYTHAPEDGNYLERKKKRKNKCWEGCKETGTPIHYWWDYKLVPPLWETVRRLLKKLKSELTYDAAIPLLGLYPQELKAES